MFYYTLEDYYKGRCTLDEVDSPKRIGHSTKTVEDTLVSSPSRAAAKQAKRQKAYAEANGLIFTMKDYYNGLCTMDQVGSSK